VGRICPLFLFGAAMPHATEQISRLLAPILASLGLVLWDLEFKKEGPRWLLRVYIDREESGVTLEDCEAVSRDLSTALDVEDAVSHAYTLEVSSPGLDRTLSRTDHFRRSVGLQIKVKTYEAVNGEKVFTGKLEHADEEGIILVLDTGSPLAIARQNIAKASRVIDLF
jgi:ribosome maturation factor RimP